MFRPELILKSMKICKKLVKIWQKFAEIENNATKINHGCNVNGKFNFLECVPFHVADSSQHRSDKRRRRRLLSALYLKKLTYLQDPRCKIDFGIFGSKCVSDNSKSISKKIFFDFWKKILIFPPNIINFGKFLSGDFGSIFGEPGMELEILIWFCSN